MTQLRGFDGVEQHLNGLISQLSPVQQRKLLRDIGRYFLLKSRKRVREQKNADDSAYEERKNKKVKRKMLIGFNRLMKTKVTTNSVKIGLFGNSANLANIHHYGESEGGISYPSRELIGWNDDDIDAIERMIAVM